MRLAFFRCTGASDGYEALMEQMAVFEDGTQAQETARVLREQGYVADVVTEGTESYGNATRRFLEGDASFRAVAAVVSPDADRESFDNAVTIHRGRVITGTV